MFLEARKVKFEINAFSKEFFTFTVRETVDASAITDLGGIIKIGRATANFSTEIVKKALFQKNKEAQAQFKKIVMSNVLIAEVHKTASGKTIFGVSVYCAEKLLHPVSKGIQRFVGSAIKHELATYGKKSKFMGLPENRRTPQLSHVEVLKKKLVENKAEILLCIGKEHTFIATTIAVHDPFEFQKRDIGKPNQRKIFAISPRLARIMINLAACASGKVLLDPFCGVGTILQEALLAKAKVVGMDVNPWCVKATMENLNWIKMEYKLKEAECIVLQGDARRLTDKIGHEVDCVVTEPDLGPALRHVPTTPYATKIIEKLEPLYSSFIGEAYKILKKDGRLVLVTPYVKTRSGKPLTMRIEEKAVNVGFKRVHPFKKEIFAKNIMAREDIMGIASFIDIDKRHKIGREIHIFQK